MNKNETHILDVFIVCINAFPATVKILLSFC